MVFYNGDRVCILHSKGGRLEFGRIQEYVEEPAKAEASGEDDANFLKLSLTGSDGFSVSKEQVNKKNEDSPGSKLPMIKIPICSVVTTTNSPPPSSINPFALTLRGVVSPMIQRSKPADANANSVMNQGETSSSSGVKVKRQVIWDDNKGENEVQDEIDLQIYRVVDRRFTVGQHVLSEGRRGRVVDCIPLATVRVCDSDSKDVIGNIMPDLDMSRIRPLSPIFAGVNLEFQGWIGQVSEVQRRVVYRFDDSSTVTRTSTDSLLIQGIQKPGNKKKNKTISKTFPYPFMPMPQTPEMPYDGKLVKLTRAAVEQFRKEEEEDKENNEGYCSRRLGSPAPSSSSTPSSTVPSSLSLTERRKAKDWITATVVSVTIVGVKMRWLGRLPANLIKMSSSKEKGGLVFSVQSLEMPPSIILGEDIKRVRPLYINPAMYFDKKGWCVCNTSETSKSGKKEKILSEKQWAFELYTSLVRSNNDGTEVGPFNLSAITLTPQERKDSSKSDDYSGKRKRCHDDEKSEQGVNVVVACKHFVRHMYKVIWEPGEAASSSAKKSHFTPHGDSGCYYGNDLEPDVSQEHKLCLGLIHSHLYVVPKKGSFMDGKCDYGVVIEKPSDDAVVVEWLKIRPDGTVYTERTLKCQLVEIDKHPSFNELHEGRIVVRDDKAAGFKLCDKFYFGTIVSVRRFKLGQISVYCPIRHKVTELWPHMLKVFVGMSMKEQIALKVVGTNKMAQEAPVHAMVQS